MLTHDDAILILDHAARTIETVEPVEEGTRNLDSYWDGGELYNCRITTQVAGRVIQSSKKVFSTYAGDPYGGMSQACYEGACDCDECDVDDRDEVEMTLDEIRAEIVASVVADANSSNHRALVYAPLLTLARDRAARLSEIPAEVAA